MSEQPQKKRPLFKALFPWLGWLGFILSISLLCILVCSQNTTMNEQSKTFHKVLSEKNAQKQLDTLSADQLKLALDRFTAFLQNIDSLDYLETEIANIYAEDAYLNDTLKSLHNRAEIKQHFLKTAKAMSSYSVEIEDISSTDQGHYIRWTMKYSAPKLAGGKEIESIGITYVVFNTDGKAILHQDYWDSTSGFFEHTPLIGGGIRFIKNRL